MGQHHSFKMSMIVAVAIVSIGAGCRGKEKRAQIRTLDSIATGELKIDQYQCQGNPSNVDGKLKDKIVNGVVINDKIIFDSSENISEEKRKPIREAVRAYFSALHPDIQGAFLTGLGGAILISSKTDVLCSQSSAFQTLNKQKEERTEACFAFVNDPANKKSSILTIIHRPNAKNIQYYGPMQFGYLYAQLYPRMDKSNEPGRVLTIHDTESTVMLEYKRSVANSFLQDLVTKKANFSLLGSLLGENAAAELSSSNGSQSLLDRLTFAGLPNVDVASRRSQIMDYFFAHAFQSMNCNKASRDFAESNYKESFRNFANVNRAILGLSAQLMGKSAASSGGAVPASSSGAEDLSLGVMDNPAALFSMLMPFMGQQSTHSNQQYPNQQYPNQQYPNQQTQSPGLAGLFSGFTGGASAPANSISQPNTPGIGSLFAMLSSAGAPGGTCGPGGCKGNCCGGNCSNCANGNCGGCSGGCNCNIG